MQQCYNPIQSFVLREHGRLDDVKDVIHSTLEYLTSPTKLERMRQQEFHSNSYILSCAKNVWIKERRRIGGQVVLDFDVQERENEHQDAEIRQQQYKLFWKYFLLMTTDKQQILRFYFQKTPNKIAAKKLGLSEDAYKKRKTRILHSLTLSIQRDPHFKELIIINDAIGY